MTMGLHLESSWLRLKSEKLFREDRFSPRHTRVSSSCHRYYPRKRRRAIPLGTCRVSTHTGPSWNRESCSGTQHIAYSRNQYSQNHDWDLAAMHLHANKQIYKGTVLKTDLITRSYLETKWPARVFQCE